MGLISLIKKIIKYIVVLHVVLFALFAIFVGVIVLLGDPDALDIEDDWDNFNQTTTDGSDWRYDLSLKQYLPGGKEITLEEAYKMFPWGVAHLAEVGLILNNGSKLYVKDGKLYIANITDDEVYYWFIGDFWGHHIYINGSFIWFECDDSIRWWTRLIEKTDDGSYRVIVVHFDDLFTHKYLVIDYNVSTDKRDVFWVVRDKSYPDPGYYRMVKNIRGKWYASNYTGPLEFFIYYSPSKEDRRIIEEIAGRIEYFARENGLNNTQKAILTAKIVQKMLVHRDAGKVYIYENGVFRPSSIKVKDSRMKQDVLEGTVCRGFAEWTASILNEMGILAYSYVFTHGKFDGESHAEAAVDISSIDIDYVRSFANDVAVINISVGKFETSFIVIEPQQACSENIGFESLDQIVDPRYPEKYLYMYVHGSKSKQLYLDSFSKNLASL